MSLLIRTDRIWDLSQPIFHDGPAWAEYDPPNLTHNYRREAEGFNAETLTLNTHTGTHVDVPYHFDDSGPTIEQVPLTAFAAPAVFLDLRERVKAGEPIGPDILDGTLDQLQHGRCRARHRLGSQTGRKRGVPQALALPGR